MAEIWRDILAVDAVDPDERLFDMGGASLHVTLIHQRVAEHFGLAPNHVSRLFRREGQIRFNDYLNSIRMNRAKFMLRNYSLTLKEIAANCGYNDIAYFCRMFKKMNNETPTQYRGVDSGVGALTRNADSAIRSSVRS